MKSGRHEALDGLRGVSALMVVVFHSTFNSHLKLLPLIQNSWLFVDFFFVLSGFIITETYLGKIRRGGDLKRFILLRLGRLYPLHLAMLGLYVAYEIAWALLLKDMVPGGRPAFEGANSPGALVASLLLGQAFGLFDHLLWNPPSWSISAEFFAYLVFAFTCLLVRNMRLVMASIALLASLLCLWLGDFENQTFLGFSRAVAGFAIGSLVSQLRADLGGWSDGALSLAQLACALLVIAFVSSSTDAFLWLAPVVFALPVAVFASDRGLLSRGLRTRPAQFLGTVSYSVYMVHFFVLMLASNAVAALQALLKIDLKAVSAPGGGENCSAARSSRVTPGCCSTSCWCWPRACSPIA